MDLVLWRHAEAEDSLGKPDDAQADMERALTPRGEKQAARMAAWLDRQLPEGTRIWVSPARRCEQTALALGRKYKLRAELAPGAGPSDLLQLAQWPQGRSPVLLVGHQPSLGSTIAYLMGLPEREFPVRKGSVWWLRHRPREAQGSGQIAVVTVQSPDVL
jgi:phosphohistidine phosphatase